MQVFIALVISVIRAYKQYSLARLWFDLKLFVTMSGKLFAVLCIHTYFEWTKWVVEL
jgi:hypothetical protein